MLPAASSAWPAPTARFYSRGIVMNLLAQLAARLRSLFRHGREDAETQDELRIHLEMETQKNLRAGMDSARGAAAGARAPGRRRRHTRSGPRRARDAAGGRSAARSRLRAAGRAPESGLHRRRRRAAGHSHRLQQHRLHDRRLLPAPPAGGRSSRPARGRLHERPQRRPLLHQLVSRLLDLRAGTRQPEFPTEEKHEKEAPSHLAALYRVA